MTHGPAFAAFLLGLLLPLSTYAFPFGGQVQTILPCFNTLGILAMVGPPIGGIYMWTPATRTYASGPPSHGGQWIIGLTGIPNVCLISVLPIITIPAISIMMMGSSR